jgi:cellulose synthase/poly-beta-1,6-N-acetylglucosamine synthase-like glycosyltransferase
MTTAATDSLPSVCFCLVSYNDEKVIGDALASIFSQDYPPVKLNVCIADGGSTDRTLEIIRQTKATVISRPDLKEQPHLRGDLAMSCIPSDILISFSADNRLLEPDALRKLVAPFADPEIAGAGSWRYGVRKGDPALCRYYALIGGADPIAVALGKADRLPHDTDRWVLRGRAEDKGAYFKISFEADPAKVSTLGANGFAYRKAYLDAVGGMKDSLHMEACLRLIEAGYKFAAVKGCHVVHLHGDLWASLKRRVGWAQLYSPQNLTRSYRVYDPKTDRLRLALLTLGFLTFLVPWLRAFKGWLRYRDPAWFLHPVVGFAFVASYGSMVVRQLAHKFKSRLGELCRCAN